jgi:TetR/AcrR family transcriptional repressor of nem operon
MKASREQAAANRERIVEVAGKLFREHGFDGIGVADLMKAAGLTHGGFYGHFKSKDDLAAQACGRALARSSQKMGPPRRGVCRRCACRAHQAVPERGASRCVRERCVLAALGSDAGRQGRAIRQALTEGLGSLVGVLTKLAPGRSRAAKRKQALADMAQMVGAMVLARAVDEPTLSKEILDAAIADLVH